MIVDANILLYAVDSTSPFHARARAWMEDRLNGPTRVGLPWQSLAAFVRIVTHPRALDRPLTPKAAWSHVQAWLDQPAAWIPLETERHAKILRDLLVRHDVRGNLVSDARLAALAIEHGVPIASADTDFARFPEIRWISPFVP
ncbi:MAG: PIN domain-containing protein [Chloroflexi bacterium]|nr:PIN domain-containing protein [Chloroflexota bacterium]